MMDDDQPKKSRTVYRPPSREAIQAQRQREQRAREGIRLQDDQELESFNQGVHGVYRPTQNWTGYHNGLLARVAAENRALGKGAEEDMIGRILGVAPQDTSYAPDAETLAMIERHEADDPIEAEIVEDLTLEQREARLAEREAELDRREQEVGREADLAAREAKLDDRERALQAYRENTVPVPEDLDDLDSLRNFRPVVEEGTYQYSNEAPVLPPTWAGRKRMTADERALAEKEGMELFGNPEDQPGAWSRLNNLDPVVGSLTPPATGPNTHRRQGNTEAERIARLAAERNYSQDADGLAHAVADMVLEDEQESAARNAAYQEHLRKEQEAYDQRQIDAQAQVDAFKKGRGDLFR